MSSFTDKNENKTRICFDYKLKLLIVNFKETHKDEMIKFSLNNYLGLMEAQWVARKYFYEHQKELNIAGKLINEKERKGYLSMPDYYALMRALIVDLDLCNNWEDVTGQILLKSTWNYCNFNPDEEYVDKIQCACSQLCCPENMSILHNELTNMNLLIACVCLTKTGITTQYEFYKKRKENDTYAKMIYDKKQKSKKPNKEKENHTIKQTKRLCDTCGLNNINITEPSWKRTCGSCYFSKPIGVCFLKLKK
jgi:hypothetical protein